MSFVNKLARLKDKAKRRFELSAQSHSVVSASQSIVPDSSSLAPGPFNDPALPGPPASPEAVSSTAGPSSLTITSETIRNVHNPAPTKVDGNERKGALTSARTILGLLENSADLFAPLKSAVGELARFIDIFDGAAKGRKDYDELRLNLDTLLDDLSQYLQGPVTPVVTTSMKNLSIGIQTELQTVIQKQNRGMMERHAQALEDLDEVSQSYRRIQGHLERLVLNANMNIWKVVDEQATEARLRQLSPTMSAVYNSAESEDVKRGPCAQETRKRELERLQNWARVHASEDICWLNGMAGTGKTTISYSLCAELDHTGELAASFFCSRLIPECRNIKFILPSIAYQLARFSRPFKYALSRVLEADPGVHTRVLKIQFENLINKPLQEVHTALPSDLVIVLDALDECENENSIGQILDILIASTPSLPIKLLVSSRPEPEIYNRIMSHISGNRNARLVLHELDQATVKNDIERYLKNELKDVPMTPSQLTRLVERCGVLFIFAATAARYINDGLALMEHEERLDIVLGLSPAVSSRKDRDIDILYLTILRAAFGNPKLEAQSCERMKLLLDTVICSQEPLTNSTLAGLLKLKSAEHVEILLQPLRSVLHMVEMSGLVATLHASFPDFMLNQQRSSTFYCDSISHHRRLAHQCFDLIKYNVPQFNICALDSSYYFDSHVEDLDERANRAVSTELFYACRYWAVHLEYGGQHTDLVVRLYDFFSVRLLLWMEVLNVKKSMHLGMVIVDQAKQWISAQGCPQEITELAHDAWRFVAMFASHSVSRSTPHIYVSMLPFWPELSPIAEHYMPRTRGMIEPRGLAMSRRHLALLSTRYLWEDVTSVAFSPNGDKVIAASGKVIYILDGNTSEVVGNPLEGHTDFILSASFSSDSTRIVSGSRDRTIRVWDAQTGKMNLGPLNAHPGPTKLPAPSFGDPFDPIISVAFSSDSSFIISASPDYIRRWCAFTGELVMDPIALDSFSLTPLTLSLDGALLALCSQASDIHVVDTRSGQMIGNPLQGGNYPGASVSSSFSPDGTCIVSGGVDHTIRLWDLRDGKGGAVPFEPYVRDFSWIAFSPDGTHIASGASDYTIQVWDVRTGKIVLGSLWGHTNAIGSIAFSPDGTRIISGGSDKTMRVWDIRSKQSAGDWTSLDGHTSRVSSVAFSPDSTMIASGSYDNTIRVWDAHSGRMLFNPLEMRWHVSSVAFSPDGALIVAGSWDGTLQVWNTHDGSLKIGPLEEHPAVVTSTAFSPDSTHIVSGNADTTVRVWSVHSGTMVAGQFIGHTDSVCAVAFSLDGRYVVSGSKDRTIRLWNAGSGELILGPLGGHLDCVRSVAFSPDNSRIISASRDNAVGVWDAQSGEGVVSSLIGHIDGVTALALSPNGALIASSSPSTNILVWDVQTGMLICGPLQEHTEQVMSIAFSRDHARLVVGSNGGTLRIWDIGRTLGTRLISPSQDSISRPEHSTPPPTKTPTTRWELMQDGCVIDPQAHLLVWVPPDLHKALLRSENTLLISTEGSFKLEFGGALIGDQWVGCYQCP